MKFVISIAMVMGALLVFVSLVLCSMLLPLFVVLWEITKFLVNRLAYLVIIIQQLVLVKFTIDVVEQPMIFSDDITRLAL